MPRDWSQRMRRLKKETETALAARQARPVRDEFCDDPAPDDFCQLPDLDQLA